MSIELKLTNLPKDLCGLRYIREDGVICRRKADHQWLVSLNADGSVSLTRYYQGGEIENWMPMPTDKAALALLAIVNGYQPPRRLDRLDRPFAQIQPESESGSAA